MQDFTTIPGLRFGLGGLDVGNDLNQSPEGFQFPRRRGASDFARETSAAIARADFARFEDRFLPLIRQSADLIGNDVRRAEQINNSVDLAQQGIERSAAAFDRDLEEQGISLSDEQRQAHERRQDLGTALAKVDAGNQTRRRALDRDFALAAGGSGLRSRYQNNGGLGR